MIIDTWVTVFWRQFVDENGDTTLAHRVDVNDCKDDAIKRIRKYYSDATMNLDKLEGSCKDDNGDKWNFFIVNRHMWGDQTRDTHSIFGVRK